MARDTTEVDDEIAQTAKVVRDSRILFWLCAAGVLLILAVGVLLIYWNTTVADSRARSDAAGITVYFGILGFGGGAALVAKGVDCREAVLSGRQALSRLHEFRKVILSGAGNSRVSILNRYKNDLPITVEGFRLKARRYRRRHNILQFIVVLGSLGASALVALSPDTAAGRSIAIVASSVVAIAAASSAYFRYKEKSLSLQGAADAIEQEHRAVQLGIGQYTGKAALEALSLFAETVEGLRSGQQRQALELDQSVNVEYQAGPQYDLQ